ncbi:MAG: UDP-glucose 4-epimerase GalE [Lysobacterales bacterium]
MSESKPRVLVTGGAGYIGSHTCKALKRARYQPVCLDDLSTGHRWAVKWGPLITGNLLFPEVIDRVMVEYQPIGVIHFAAKAYVGESVRDPQQYYRNNVVGTLNLLDAMRRHKVDRLVFSSTCATYGEPRLLPIPEAHPQFPINPYGRTKLIIEQALRDYGSAYGLKSASLRYFNAAGADADCDVGELHEPETHLIPMLLEVAAGLRESVTVFGQEYDTRDGTCVRDYVHVSDLAEAHLLALETLEGGGGTQTYNLGLGEGQSVREVIRAVEKVTGQSVKVIDGPNRPGDAPTLVADATRALNRLRWQPQYTNMEAIIETAWKWLQHRQKNRERYTDS